MGGCGEVAAPALLHESWEVAKAGRWKMGGKMITEPFLETITSGLKRTAQEAKASIPAWFGDTAQRRGGQR